MFLPRRRISIDDRRVCLCNLLALLLGNMLQARCCCSSLLKRQFCPHLKMLQTNQQNSVQKKRKQRKIITAPYQCVILKVDKTFETGQPLLLYVLQANSLATFRDVSAPSLSRCTTCVSLCRLRNSLNAKMNVFCSQFPKLNQKVTMMLLLYCFLVRGNFKVVS